MIRSDFARKMMSNSVAQGLNFGSRWLLNLALARHLLETEFGLFSFVYMLANLFFPTIAFGVNFYLIHHAARQRNIGTLFSSLTISLLVFVLLAAGFFIYSQAADDPLQYSLYLLSLAIGLVWALNQAIFSYLKGAQQFAIEVKSQLLGSFLMLVLVAFVWFGALDDTATVLGWILLLSLAPLLVGVKVVWPEFRQAAIAPVQMWRQLWQGKTWRDRLSYAWHDVFAIYLTNIPFIFLAMFSTLTALGQFRKAFILFMPVTLLPVVFSQVLLSKLSAKPQLSDKVELFKRILLFSLPLLSLPYLLLMLLYPWLYPWLLNERLTPDTDLVTLLVVITLWLTLVKTYFEVWITATGRSDWRAANVTLVALLSSLAYLWINQDLDSVTAAWVFMLSNLTAVIFLQLLCWRCYRKDKKATAKAQQITE
ncbi:lipopolysaccharide biosynthesis protein [Rheinheimera sp.]|uniref:lipopolysaccharide biosynthesis protein n=1 Tax=Rheinheimera sp. TaxID=1869214 RepID=UPI0027BA6F73|nr:oligosaccharide flippase family protein [Rheinheimera sp.]